MTDTYGGERRIRTITVEHFAENGLTTTDHWGWGPPPGDWHALVHQGDDFEVEEIGSRIVGLRWPGSSDWLYRHSDEDLEAEHQRFIEARERRNREMLDANREDWTRREALLPRDLQERLAYFREKGGEHFELDGWGYELIVAELAVLYREAGFDKDGSLIESTAVNEYAEREGTSGNQHSVAKMLVITSSPPEGSEPGLPPKDFPAALMPLGETRDYSPRS